MVPVPSVRISRVPTYSGFRSLSFRFHLREFHPLRYTFPGISVSFRSRFIAVLTPNVFLHSVWALPISLATTFGITFVFFSSGYLDVSVPRVPLRILSIHIRITRLYPCGVPSFGYLRITGYLLLPATFRSLSRPSSAPRTKASSVSPL